MSFVPRWNGGPPHPDHPTAPPLVVQPPMTPPAETRRPIHVTPGADRPVPPPVPEVSR